MEDTNDSAPKNVCSERSGWIAPAQVTVHSGFAALRFRQKSEHRTMYEYNVIQQSTLIAVLWIGVQVNLGVSQKYGDTSVAIAEAPNCLRRDEGQTGANVPSVYWGGDAWLASPDKYITLMLSLMKNVSSLLGPDLRSSEITALRSLESSDTQVLSSLQPKQRLPSPFQCPTCSRRRREHLSRVLTEKQGWAFTFAWVVGRV